MTADNEANGQNSAASTEKATSTGDLLSPLHKNCFHVPHLPFDLVADILCRLPVKHLLQLRCVCKSWNSLIAGDSMFAKKHLRLSTSNHEHHHLILTPELSSKEELVVCQSPISSILSFASNTSIKQLRYSIGEILIKEGDYRASTCDGIICFKIDDCSALLCNPSIRKFKILPPLKIRRRSDFVITYTLVYDRFINNYKVIALAASGYKIEVKVHTFGTNGWRRVRDYFPGPNLFPMAEPGIFVNDSANWLTYNSADWLTHGSPCYGMLIVSLNLEKKSFQKLALPFFEHFINPSMTLGTLRGCLSLLRSDKFSDIWIMKEYGNENSWTKLVTLPSREESHFYYCTKALYISSDDQVLMECCTGDGNNLVVYDSINNTFNIPKFQNNIHSMKVAHDLYVESLISPL
ncbi:unnamed protein product [Lathyrus sativus]|nr:unnamed protein product [Lathyrus sativus]